MVRKLNKKKRPIDPTFYQNASINDLILFSMYSVISNDEECTFERLIKECFNLFPRAFGFSKSSQWPDARKLDRPLRTLRKRKLIVGSPEAFFSLTKEGKKKALEITNALRQGKLL